jgi:hypothetical protein
MAATDARPVPLKGVAYRVTLPIYDNDGDLVTSAAGLDSEVSLDGAAFADCTNEATEIAEGVYYLDLTAAEMAADTVAVVVKTSTTDAKPTLLILYPEEAGDIRVNATQISGDGTAADNLEAAADGTGYNLGGGSIVATSVTDKTGYALTAAYDAAKTAAQAGDAMTLTAGERTAIAAAHLATTISGLNASMTTDSIGGLMARIDAILAGDMGQVDNGDGTSTVTYTSRDGLASISFTTPNEANAVPSTAYTSRDG